VNEAIQQALNNITLADMQQAAIPRAFRVPAGGHERKLAGSMLPAAE
jgi:hypothetical protein